MNRRLAGLAVLAVVALSGCNATTSFWRMNETTGTVMNDSTGSNDGTTSNVGRGTPSYDGSGFYVFNGVNSTATVPNSASLNPGDANFSFGAAVKFTAVPPPGTFDVIRKGTAPGQNYKIDLRDSGTTTGVRARCVIIGSVATTTIVAGSNLNDNAWHTLTCSRTGNIVALDITTDGVTRRTTKEIAVGSVSNTSPLTIGSKPTGTDFYNGAIDDAKVSVG